MKKSNLTKHLIVLFLSIGSFFTLTSCEDEEQSQNALTSIASIAQSNPNLSSLAAALNRAELTGTLNASGTYTVFAPTNQAFSNFLAANGFDNLNEVPVPILKEILLNHVIAEVRTSTSLPASGYIKTLGKGSASSTNTLSMYVNKSEGVVLNGISEVTTANISANNGVIHIVDAVIGLPTIVDHAVANSNFSRLVGALTSAGQPDFVSILSGTGPYTVFAPTNSAFTDLDAELAAIPLVPTAEQLTSVLQYHVLNGNVLSSDLPTVISGSSAGFVTALNEQQFEISLNGGAKIIDANSRNCNIVATDVQCSNGVIHVLSKVLLPNLD
jgi:uncharacterized surface protein with fasciclin (FAS1) repeats